MNKHMMIVSIGGIQSFISNAITTNDLYQSSKYVQNMVKLLYDFTTLKFATSHTEDDNEMLPNYFIITFQSEENEQTIEQIFVGLLKEHKTELHPDLPVFYADVVIKYFKEDYQRMHRKLQACKFDRTQHFSIVNPYLSEDEPEKICVLCKKREGTIKNAIALDKTRSICEPCYKKLDDKQPFASTRDISGNCGYYAFIRADIDSLGTKIADIDNLEKLNKLQNSINKFMLETEKKLTDTTGMSNIMIYNGGDDLICFCPIHHVQAFLQSIDEAFKGVAEEYQLTYSKSIIFAHEKYPLRNVVQLSAKRLDNVKHYFRNEGKTGTDFTWIDRSASIRSVCMKLTKDYEEISVALNRILRVFENNELSRSVVWALEEEFLLLGMDTTTLNTYEMDKIIDHEICRITKRKCSDKAEKEQTTHDMITLFYMFKRDDQLFLRDYLQLLHILEKWSQCLYNEGGKKKDENNYKAGIYTVSAE